MKPGAYVFVGCQEPEVEKTLKEKYRKIQIESQQLGISLPPMQVVNPNKIQMISEKPGEMRFLYGDNYRTKMAGHYQLKNAALAIEVMNTILPEVFGIEYSDVSDCIKKGIEQAFWPGRFEVLSENPLFIMDGAHNEDAAKQLARSIENCFTNQPLTYIIGVLADKEHQKMLEIMLNFASKVYTITPANARGLDGRLLMEEAKGVCQTKGLAVDIEYCQTLKEALDKATDYGKEYNQPILAFGSLSYLGSLKQEYKHICESRNENDR
jgi:dihydrofolate synthase/folylpolyglutamate synthase